MVEKRWRRRCNLRKKVGKRLKRQVSPVRVRVDTFDVFILISFVPYMNFFSHLSTRAAFIFFLETYAQNRVDDLVKFDHIL